MADLFSADSEPEAAVAGYVLVAPEQGLDSPGLTYALPSEPAELANLDVGQRVLVPLGRGNKTVPGFVTRRLAEHELPEHLPRHKIKHVARIDPTGVSLPEELMRLAAWMADYYCCPLGMVLQTMLPAAVKRGTGQVSEQLVALPEPTTTPEDPDATDDDPAADTPRLTRLQTRILQAMTEATANGEAWLSLRDLADRAGAKTTGPVKQLVAKGALQSRQHASVRAGWDALLTAPDQAPPRPELNEDQARVLHDVAAAGSTGFSVHLIHGVTGSGKTEVYLRLIERVRQAPPPATEPAESLDSAESETGNTLPPAVGVIILVPEIALTPQTAQRFLSRFDGVAVLHSALTDAQRHEQWRRIRDGQASIVIGARSAVFAPVHRLGLIIVDEEHEGSYKQDQLPRYHARDVAVKRGQIAGVPVVLGSATPSLESYHNAVGRKIYRLHELPRRVAGQKLPPVTVLDLRQERVERRGIHIVSRRLEQLLRHVLDEGDQAILLLNRRGYANWIACPDHGCGWQMNCDHCDAMMIYHRDRRVEPGGLLRCHHCQAEQVLPSLCPHCGKRITVFGMGTQRVEEELLRKFPDLAPRDAADPVASSPMLRMDGDTMRSSRDYFEALESFRRGERRVLVGTQMIAKGLDFPNVRLVGVLSADTALNLPDFRASERTFQLIAQVAGRAGRSDKPGIVLVQSLNPEDPAIGLAARHDYRTFAQRELDLRRECGMPPIGRMARVVCRDLNDDVCQQRCESLTEHLHQHNERLGGVVQITGPEPCAVSRIADYFRFQIELLAPDAVSLQRLLAAARNANLLHADNHTAVDVDPISLM